MEIPFLDLKKQYLSIKNEIHHAIEQVLDQTAFSEGSFVKTFEEEFADSHNAKHCVATNSGTSALHLALMALDVSFGDEVIVPGFTFFATPEAVSLAGATPVFVDSSPTSFNIDPDKIQKAISHKTKAIIVVHLFGEAVDIDPIKEIAAQNKLFIIEDCAQAHLAKYKEDFVGTLGVCGCFSFYPGKNLGAYGEGGAVITNDDELSNKMTILKNHGSSKKYHHDYIGHNYRMGGLQASILSVKLKHLSKWTSQRRINAELYKKYLQGLIDIALPFENKGKKHVYHQYVIQTGKRNDLNHFLNENKIETRIHYLIPCHLQKAYQHLNYHSGDLANAEKYSKEVLSLPMSEQLTREMIDFICKKVKDFFKP